MSTIDDYRIVLYRQSNGWWVATIPAITGCHAIMQTREEVLAEIENVFEMIREEYEEEGKPLPVDPELVYA